MKQFTLFVTFLFVVGCTPKESVKEKTLRLLTTEKAVNYSFTKLTIQGSTENDTTFIETTSTASFKKLQENNGYCFVVQDSLEHPFFRVPFKNIYHYDGKIYTYALISSQKKDLQKRTKLEPNVYNNLMEGQLPNILYSLQNDSTIVLKDFIINGEKCSHFQLINDKIPYSLFISKERCLPVLLRVVINASQPFIQEYSYSDFTFSNQLIIPDYEEEVKAKIIKKTISPLTKGDVFPDWEFKNLQGDKVSITSSRSLKIVYLSMINCGACRAALPYVENIFEKYKNNNDVDFHVLYPADSKQKLSKYVKDENIITPILFNKETEDDNFAEIVFKLRMGYPSTLILDRENEIAQVINGFSTSLETIINKEIIKIKK